MFDSSLITYAVSLHFSQKVNDIVISTLQAIADETGNRFMIENKIPPHITIGAFHAAREEEAKLLQLVEEFAQGQKAGSVQFSKVGDFNGKVLFFCSQKRITFFPKLTRNFIPFCFRNLKKQKTATICRISGFLTLPLQQD